MTRRTVHLEGISDKSQVLAAIGEALCLGGSGGNHPARSGEEKGWGMNWDALFDCLLNLHSGGIWGTSPTLDFPLALTVVGAGALMGDNPQAFAVLQDILEQTRETYAKRGMDFTFHISP